MLNAELPDEELEPPSEPESSLRAEAEKLRRRLNPLRKLAGDGRTGSSAAIEGEPAAETPVEAEAEAKRLARQQRPRGAGDFARS